MKKFISLLFVSLVVLTCILGCTQKGNKNDVIILKTWEIGKIQLNGGDKIIQSYGVEFSTENGVIVDYSELNQGEFYFLKKNNYRS